RILDPRPASTEATHVRCSARCRSGCTAHAAETNATYATSNAGIPHFYFGPRRSTVSDRLHLVGPQQRDPKNANGAFHREDISISVGTEIPFALGSRLIVS